MARRAQPARQIGKQKLLDLVKHIDNANKRMAEERGALGGKMEAAATSDNFDAKALRPLLPLLKLDPGPQAHRWRTMLLYADHLGIGAQADLEDFIPEGDQDEGGDADEDEDGADDGDGAEEATGDDRSEAVADARALAAETTGEATPEADPVDQVLAGIVTPQLGRFRTALADCATVEAVNRGLERFTEDHPDDAEDALTLAQARLEAIAAEAGGGEDLRPTSLREGEKAGAADTVHATTGKKPGKPRKPRATRADAGKVGQEAPAFGGRSSEAGGSVH